MWHELLVAFALLLVIEGVMPFLNPGALRQALILVAKLDDKTLRFAGLTAMVVGCLLLYAANR